MTYRVLIVDDMASQRKLLELHLKKLPDVVCDSAGSVSAALQQLMRCAYDLLILDLMMPEQNGFYLLERLKGNRQQQDLPVIVQSALGDNASIQQALSLGAYDYFTKPFTEPVAYASLLVKAQNAMRWYRQRQELQQELQKRQSAERRLQQMHATLENVLESLPEGVYVQDVNEQSILFANGTARQQWEKMSLHKPDDDLCRERSCWECYHAESDTWYEVVERSMHWLDGREVELLISRDVSDRKRMDALQTSYRQELEDEVYRQTQALQHVNQCLQEELEQRQQMQERLSATLAAVPDVMLLIRHDGWVLEYQAGREALLGELPASGKALEQFLPPAAARQLLELVNLVLAGQVLEQTNISLLVNDMLRDWEVRGVPSGSGVVLLMLRDQTFSRREHACNLLLRQLSLRIIAGERLDRILRDVCRELMTIFHCSHIAIGRYETKNSLYFLTEVGGEGDVRQLPAEGWQELLETALASGQPQWRQELDRFFSIWPLRFKNRLIGVLRVVSLHRLAADGPAMLQLEALANQMGLALDAALERQRIRLLQAGLEASSNAVVITSRQGEVYWANRTLRVLAGLPGDRSFTGLLLQDLLFPSETGLQALLKQALQKQEPWQGEGEYVSQNGKRQFIEITLNPIRGAGGRITHWIAVFQDSSEKKKLEQERLQAQAAISRAERLASLSVMAAGISHEINQPLNYIKLTASGMLFWYERGVQRSWPELMQDVQKISDEASRIEGIIRYLRSFVHREQSSLQLCDIHTAIHNVLQFTRRRVEAHGVRLETELAADLPAVEADMTGLEEIVINLTVNAMQAMDGIRQRDKRIVIRTWHTATQVGLAVIDNGPGIPAAERERIFEPFFSTKQNEHSMGLGLSIVNSLVKSYQASIRIADGIAGGIMFEILFPIPQEPMS